MSSKIRIKMGQVEVEYEGSDDFLKKEFPELLKSVAELCDRTKLPDDLGGGEDKDVGHKGKVQMATASVAAKLRAKSGTELLLAACAHLSIVKRLGAFSRQQILKEMQSASSYYRKSYGNNMTKYIATVVGDGKLIESAKNTYALSADTKAEMEKKLVS